MKYKIFYEDGTTYTGQDSEHWGAPKRKVQADIVTDGATDDVTVVEAQLIAKRIGSF